MAEENILLEEIWKQRLLKLELAACEYYMSTYFTENEPQQEEEKEKEKTWLYLRCVDENDNQFGRLVISQMIHEYQNNIRQNMPSISSSIVEANEENKWCITIRIVKKDLSHKHDETE